MQYAASWTNAKDTAQRLADIRDIYAAMRPYVSGAAYVNYCVLVLAETIRPPIGARTSRA